MAKIQVDTGKAEKFKGEEIRRERDRLIAACDWTMLPDSTADKVAWGAYRQMLRDVPEQAGFPHRVEWPIVPD